MKYCSSIFQHNPSFLHLYKVYIKLNYMKTLIILTTSPLLASLQNHKQLTELW